VQVAAALLADFASVRDNLLYVVGGGITRVYRDSYPAAMGISLALVIELHRMERDRAHEIEVEIVDEDGKALAKIKGGFQVGSTDAAVHESLMLPLAFDLRPVGLERPGWHSVEISVDSQHQRTLQFLAGSREAPT
jgi:hypothetical protein